MKPRLAALSALSLALLLTGCTQYTWAVSYTHLTLPTTPYV